MPALIQSFREDKRSIYQGEVPDNFSYNLTQIVLRNRRLYSMYD